jgi:hypothetical protein
MWPLATRQHAIALRKSGWTLQEIRRQISGLPKGTLSGWVKHIEISRTQQDRILRKIDDARVRARERAGMTNHRKRFVRVAAARAGAEREYQQLRHHPLFLPGLLLYWAEGAKTQEWFLFMNSDPRLIVFMIRWLQEVCGIPRNLIVARLYLHHVYASKHPERQWMRILKLPKSNYRKSVYKPTPHTTRKNPSYLGCMRLQVTRAHLFRKIMRWIELFAHEHRLG